MAQWSRLRGLSIFGGCVFAFGAAMVASSLTYAQADPAVQTGQAVMASHNCGGCHTIPGIDGASGTFGPDLGPTDHLPPISERNPIAGSVSNGSPDDLAAWILDPQSLKPGTLMPRLGLSPDEAAAAAAYLYAVQEDGSVTGLD